MTNAVVFGNLFDPVKPGDGIFRAFFVRHAGAVSGKCYHVGHPGLGRQRNVFAKPFFNLGVVLGPVHAVDQVAIPGITHAAHQTVAPRHFVFIRFEQVDSLQANLCRIGAELVERDVYAAMAIVNVAL